MFYKKFATDKDECIDMETIEVMNDGDSLAFVQLITDGVIVNQTEKTITVEGAKDYIFSMDGIAKSEENISSAPVLSLSRHLAQGNRVILKKSKILKPSYCMFTVYAIQPDAHWALTGREILVNKENKMFSDINLMKNMQGDDFYLDVAPEHEKQGVKVFQKKR